MIEHIARRGLQHAHGVLTRSDNSTAPISAFGYTLISTTAFLFMFLTFATVYTLTHLLPTLAIVETPTAAITVSEVTEDYGSKGEKDGLVDTVTLVHQKPITSSIRATIRHVVSEGGKLARWRGYLQYLAYVIAVAFVGSFVKTLIPLGGIPAEFIATGITGAVTANLHAAWTHKTIASPHRMSFMEGIPSRKLWKKLALPAAFHAVTPYISMFVLTVLVTLLGLNKGMSPAQSNQYTGAQVAWFLARAFFILVMGVACTLFLCIPAHVTLVRIEASLLPEEHDTIVPFDRTFDGKAVSKLLGGTGSVSFLDAWKSFNWEARRRLIKLYVKAFFVIMALMLVFVHVMVFELYIFLGPRLGSAFAEAKHGMML